MENATLLHLAILRKISRNNPSGNYRQRFSSIKRKQLYANITEEIAPPPPMPLAEIRHNGQKRRPKESRDSTKKKAQNMTISGWSTKSIDYHQVQEQKAHQQTRYEPNEEKKPKKNTMFRKRHLSQVNNIKLKAPPIGFNNFIPDYEFKKRYRIPPTFKPRYYPLKQASINYRPQTEQIQNGTMEVSEYVSEKLSSFDAFIAEMKQRARNKKIKL